MKPQEPSRNSKLIDQTLDRAFWKVRHGSRSIWVIAHMDGTIDHDAPLMDGYKGNYQRASAGKKAWAIVKSGGPGKTAATSPVQQVLRKPAGYFPLAFQLTHEILVRGNVISITDELARTVEIKVTEKSDPRHGSVFRLERPTGKPLQYAMLREDAPSRFLSPAHYVAEMVATYAENALASTPAPRRTKTPTPTRKERPEWSAAVAGRNHGYATEVEADLTKTEAMEAVLDGGSGWVMMRGTQMWNEPLGQVEESRRPAKLFDYHWVSRQMRWKTAAVPEKYTHIGFKPPESVANAAKKGLEYRQKASPSNRGGLTTEEAGEAGIGSGVQRAVNLKNRTDISPETIKQMHAFFSRHEKNKSISEENKGEPWNDKGYVAWLLWGGDPGKSWVGKILKQMEAADAKEEKKSASRLAARWLRQSAYDPESWYYDYEPGMTLQTIIDRWQEDRPGVDRRGQPLPRQKMYDHAMPIYLTVRELWPLREYTWSRETARSGFAKVDGKSVELPGPLKWDALKEDMRKRGWDPKDPLILDIGSEGGVKVGEGNHRLALARELGMSKVPVSIYYKTHKVRKNPSTRSEPVEIKGPSLKKVVEKRVQEVKKEQKPRSPKEQAELDQMVENLMNLLF